MELKGQKYLGHTTLSDRATDWNWSQNSHAPKVSIGVVLETSAKCKLGNMTISSSAQRKCKVSQGNTVEEDRKMGLCVFLDGKESVAPNQESGGWFSPKSLRATTKDNQAQSNADHNLVLQSGDIQQNMFMDFNCGTGNENRINNEKMEEFAFVTGHEMHISDKGIERRRFSFERKMQKDGNLDKVDEFAFTAGQISIEEGKRNQQELDATTFGGNDALRLKLSEILGTAPSQKDQITNVPNPETDTRNSKSSLKGNKRPKSVKAKQNSDTIETDSESPYQAARTPLTRSRTRKKASGKVESKLLHEASGNIFSNSRKVKCQETNTFSFNKAEKQSGKSLLANKMENTLLLEGKSASHCSKNEVSKHQANVCSSTPVNAGSLDFHSPTLAINSFMDIRFPGTSLPGGTALGNSFSVDGRSKLGELQTKISRSPPIASSTELSNDSSEGNQAFKSHRRGSSPLMEQNDTPKRLSLPTTEEQNDESLQKYSLSSKGFRATSRWSSGTVTPQTTPNMFLHSNRLQIERPETLTKPFLNSPSPEDFKNEESGALEGMSDQNSDNALPRAVLQIALVLEKYKAKVKLHTSEKSSEILVSVANGVHSHLRSIESQIWTDVEKLSSLSRSKRKLLESKFEEQQERLKVTRDKFKEEVNTHLEEYRTTLEELEACHLELKGNADRQTASCKKVLLQAEEAVRAQLCEAERSIAAIHKGGRKKMQGLQLVLRKCLKEAF